jgi:hypothetical protein
LGPEKGLWGVVGGSAEEKVEARGETGTLEVGWTRGEERIW